MKKSGLWVGLFLILVAHALVYWNLKEKVWGEPDTYFVLGLSRAASEGIVRRIPQFEDIGWAKSFFDKNFLFTAMTGLAYRVAQMGGVLALVPILSFVFLVFLFLSGVKYVRPLIAVAGILILFLDPLITYRLFKLRPHVMGMAAYAFILFGLLARKPRITGVACAMFVLSYHMFIIPLFVLGVAALAWGSGNKIERKTFKYGVIGLALGLVLNPYFPSNLVTGLKELGIALNLAGISAADRPIENLPLASDAFLSRYGFYLLLILAAVWVRSWVYPQKLVWRNLKKMDSTAKDLLFLCAASCALWVGTALSPRTQEYAIPTTLVLLMATMAIVPAQKVFAAVVGVLALAMLGPHALDVYLDGFRYSADPRLALEAVESIPASATGKKVFNCEWNVSPYVYFKRPDLRSVDVSDPSLLASASPVLHALRKMMKEEQIAYPYGVIRDAFKADFVLCNDKNLVMELERDAHFTRIYPKVMTESTLGRNGSMALFSVRESTLPNEVFQYELHKGYGQRWPDSEWKPFQLQTEVTAFKNAAYVDFKLQTLLTGEHGMANASKRCTTVRPSPRELSSHLGATVLGVGGGPQLKIWWNGKPLYLSESATFPRALSRFVPLPKPLARTDTIEAAVCAGPDAQYEGIGMSFWTEVEIQAVCRAKNGGVAAGTEEKAWTYNDEGRKSCLADFAAKG